MNESQLLTKYFICYSIFFITLVIARLHNSHKLLVAPGRVAENLQLVTRLHISGIVSFLIIPLLIMDRPLIEVLAGNHIGSGIDYLLLIFLLAIVVYAALWSSEKFISRQAQASHAGIPISFIRLYLLLRVAFIFSYEIWFRGHLLQDSIERSNMWSAIVLNIILYLLLHVFSSRTELIGCVIFGAFLCLLAIYFNGAWPAVILHLVLALVYEYRILAKSIEKRKPTI